MFRKLIKNKKAQNTAEYAILISLVVAGIIAMQTYAQRALQARVRDAGQHLAVQGAVGGNQTVQYEPYYLTSAYNVARDDRTVERLGQGVSSIESDTSTNREIGGFQQQGITAGVLTGL